MNIKIKKDDVIQVNEKVPEWCGCLMIVDEVKTWGVVAYMCIPPGNGTYIRLTYEQIEYIGPAVLVKGKEEAE